MAFRLTLYSLILLLHHVARDSLAAAASSGTLAFFLDQNCQEASIINPTVDLAVATCLVTPGADGIAVINPPPCTSGDAATPILYRDTSCANAERMNIDYEYSNCYFDGPSGVTAIMFTCPKVAGGSLATATSTASASSSSMAVAVGAPTAGSTALSPTQNAPAPNGAVVSASLANPSSSASSQANRTNSGTTGDGNDNRAGGNGKGSGLSTTQVIAVVCPVGAAVIALLAWLFPCGGRHKLYWVFARI
ncbi:MAG: hypothetical protein Q9208_005542 [Pyrenodesmia sp. 3 TL-2023]